MPTKEQQIKAICRKALIVEKNLKEIKAILDKQPIEGGLRTHFKGYNQVSFSHKRMQAWNNAYCKK